jgi:hypothetical protein
MSNEFNYLLGFGERLTEKIDKPQGGGKKKHPYTFEDAKRRLLWQIEETAQEIDKLPSLACPKDEAVAAVTLHPSYVAKSHYPEELFNVMGVTAVGSKQTEISPTRWAVKNHPAIAPTTMFFVSGARKYFREFVGIVSEMDDKSRGAGNLRRIESFSFPTNKQRPMITDTDYPLLEVVLHAYPQSGYILDGFREFLDEFDIRVDLDRRLHSSGLCFLPVRAPREMLNQISKFSFLRVIREMPQLRVFRPITRSYELAKKFDYDLPDALPLDPTLKVGILDGGLPKTPDIERWVKYKEPTGIKQSVPEFEQHGLAVTSALLFGSMEQNDAPPVPYSHIEHWRVLDTETEQDSQSEYYSVIKRIQDILQTKQYDFVNLSIGPDLPIEDDEVHAWTSIIDPLLSHGRTLATIAVGNRGNCDWDSGNARVQSPADCVNALSIGAADSQSIFWKRASYSCVGPGRSPGIVKPDALSFGGSSDEPYFVLKSDTNKEIIPVNGTSFASPNALRTAVGVRAVMGNVLTPLAVKSLIIHRCETSGYDLREVGRGCIIDDVDTLIACEPDTAHVVYQGELSPAEWMRVKIPTPSGDIPGLVEIAATICYATETDPHHPANYTRSGLEICFRPHNEKFRKKPKSSAGEDEEIESSDESYYGLPKTRPFFTRGKMYVSESELRDDAHKWETTMTDKVRIQGDNLKDPTFDMHYNARAFGGPNQSASKVPYALVVTVRKRGMSQLYNKIVQRYRAHLEILRPAIRIPLRH